MNCWPGMDVSGFSSNSMSFFIPENLQQSVLTFGAMGEEWLRNLPVHVSRLEKEWGVTVGEAIDHGGCVSWVAPVHLTDGSEAILKVAIPHEEARFEADALSFLGGKGAVQLLRVSQDGFSLLLERCVPGNDLWSLPETEADDIATKILPRLWHPTPKNAPFDCLSNRVAQWCDDIVNIVAATDNNEVLVHQALEYGKALAATQPKQVFLHGDFHPGNVLAAEREPWLVIDPKPLVGEPAFDLAQWLFNRSRVALLTDEPVSLLCKQITYFADRLELSPQRIAGWAFVKAVGWECGTDLCLLFQKVAECW